jgi:hypothetical protein
MQDEWPSDYPTATSSAQGSREDGRARHVGRGNYWEKYTTWESMCKNNGLRKGAVNDASELAAPRRLAAPNAVLLHEIEISPTFSTVSWCLFGFRKPPFHTDLHKTWVQQCGRMARYRAPAGARHPLSPHTTEPRPALLLHMCWRPRSIPPAAPRHERHRSSLSSSAHGCLFGFRVTC